MTLTLHELSGAYTVARLAADTPIPAWADGPGFFNLTRTPEELSIICRDERVPKGVQADGPWTCFQLVGPFDLSLTGIAVRLVEPVSNARIGFLFVTTFDTDYLLVKSAQRSAAMAALQTAGIVFAG